MGADDRPLERNTKPINSQPRRRGRYLETGCIRCARQHVRTDRRIALDRNTKPINSQPRRGRGAWQQVWAGDKSAF
jgi:hypothetical protein